VTDSGNAGGERFRAYVAEQKDDEVERGLRDLGPGDLPDGDVTVRVAYSSVNYKDALATIPKGAVARIPLLIPGIDLAGEVVASDSPDVAVGDQVVVHGYGLGTSHHGGFAELARVPAGWVVPLPAGSPPARRWRSARPATPPPCRCSCWRSAA
jgi:acrylyl-CoA reductase (NADPH)